LYSSRKKKNIPPAELSSFPKKESKIQSILQHDKLHKETEEIKKKLSAGVVPGSLLPVHFQKKKITDQKKKDDTEIENNNIMELIFDHLPEHWHEAKLNARHLEEFVKEERVNEKKDRQERKEREREERRAREKAQREAEELARLKIEQKEDEALEATPKKPKTKVVTTKDNEGWMHQKILDEEGKELDKSKSEENKPKSKKPASDLSASAKTPKADKVDPTRNTYDISPEEENELPTQSEYVATVRDQRLKGKPEKPEKPKSQKPKSKLPESKEKEKKEPQEKKAKSLKVSKKGEEKKPAPANKVVADNVPFWQNELFKPLVYVFGLVSLLSLIYLVLN